MEKLRKMIISDEMIDRLVEERAGPLLKKLDEVVTELKALRREVEGIRRELKSLTRKK